MKSGKAGTEAGYTYFGLLLAILGASLAVSAGVTLLGNEVRRDKEAELMFAGDEIRRAIELYHAKNAASPHPFPKKMGWLLHDPNQPSLQRYLRKIYRDPVRNPDAGDASVEDSDWVSIVDANGQIVGVHSNSAREPLRQTGFPKQYESVRQAKHYSDWKFIAGGSVPVEPKASSNVQPKNFVPALLAPVPATPATRATTEAAHVSPNTPPFIRHALKDR
ncbi:MAG: hypothetical protein WCL29_05525 [Pseudomonadota bacterium]